MKLSYNVFFQNIIKFSWMPNLYKQCFRPLKGPIIICFPSLNQYNFPRGNLVNITGCRQPSGHKMFRLLHNLLLELLNRNKPKKVQFHSRSSSFKSATMEGDIHFPSEWCHFVHLWIRFQHQKPRNSIQSSSAKLKKVSEGASRCSGIVSMFYYCLLF